MRKLVAVAVGVVVLASCDDGGGEHQRWMDCVDLCAAEGWDAGGDRSCLSCDAELPDDGAELGPACVAWAGGIDVWLADLALGRQQWTAEEIGGRLQLRAACNEEG